nr:hypothetical protein [Tanacetum cinerariifolium]
DEFSLPEEVPTTSEEKFPLLKKRDATADKDYTANEDKGQSLNGKPKTGIANPRSGGSVLNGENANPNFNNISRKVDTTQPMIGTSVLEGMKTGNTSTLTGENNTRVLVPNNIGDSLASPSFENPNDVNLTDQLGNETQTVGNIWGTTEVNENHEGTNTKSFVNVVTGTKPNSKINFRTLFNEERVENSDFVLPMANVVAAKNKFANSLVGIFIGKRVAFPLVKNYVTNTWGKFGFQSVIKDDDDVYYFKFSTTKGLEQVMEQGPWLIRNQPLILTQWTPNLNLEKNKVKKVPIWVKIHKVPVVAYSEDGLSLIGMQIGKPVMLDAFSSSICTEVWGRIGFARALIEVDADRNLKEEVVMAVPRLEVEIPKETIEASDGFTMVQNRRKKGKNVANGVPKASDKEFAMKIMNHFSALQDENITHHTNTSDATTSDVQAENGATNVVDDDSKVEDLGNEYKVMKIKIGASTPPIKFPNVFRNWDWSSNANVCTKGCRIIVGWNKDIVDVVVISISNQTMHTKIIHKSNQKPIFCTFVYVGNNQKERRLLWHNLDVYHSMVSGIPWTLLGDFNVALNIEDNLTGGSAMTSAMISDHSLAVLKFPSIVNSKPRPFKFFNLLAYKSSFLVTVSNMWSSQVHGCYMYQVVQKMKMLKKPLRKLLHSHRNLHDRVNKLRVELDAVQKALDQDPHNSTLREEKAVYLFHKTIKGKNQRSRIEIIRNPNNIEFTGSSIADCFVEHYMAFLGVNEPCPDGYSSLFFKESWDTVGEDVCRAVRDFFRNGKILKEINHTLLVLVPKVAAPMKINDYHPISCCNVIYKCISKIITNRIIDGVGEVVSENQSAFIPGRRILDNILITQELMHNYHHNTGSPRCAFKVDIQKAYDTVDWKFLERILKRSLSPYLFTMVMEVLTLILQRRVRLADFFHYHPHCESLQLINVCFADDLFMFYREELQSAELIMDALEEFKTIPGLVPSIPKSTVFFCGVPNHIKMAILNIMPFQEEKLPVKYLGIPLISSRLLNKDCKILVEKVQNRIGDWKNKSLSFVGRLQLCQSVISSMHVYWASVLVIPVGIIHDIEQLMRGFL